MLLSYHLPIEQPKNMANTDLASRYAEAMKYHPYGHGLYVPESSQALMPSACGYLDEHGRWEPIAYLDDPKSLSEAGLSVPQTLVPRRARKFAWGPKKSSSVNLSKVGLEAGVSTIAAGFPASVKLVLDFESTSDYGAVLHCPEQVICEGYHRRGLLQWAKKNAKALLKVAPDIEEEGEFWIVTDTYATTDVWVNAWTGRGKHVMMGFNVDLSAIGAGEIGPSCEFSRENHASAEWDHTEAEVCQPIFALWNTRY